MLVKTDKNRDKSTADITVTPQGSKIDEDSRIKFNRKFVLCEPENEINLFFAKPHSDAMDHHISPRNGCLGLHAEVL